MRLFRSEAIVLRHLDYGEADRIVTFFAPGHGRLRGFARGARNSRRRFAAALEPFASAILHWSPPRSGGLVTLKEAELLDLRVGLRADLPAIALAGYGCELIEALFAEAEAQDEVYSLLRSFLDALALAGGSPLFRLLFELRLLNLSGYIPHLLHCAACFGALPGPRVSFAAAQGGSLCPACAGGGSGISLSLLTLGSVSRILNGPLTAFAEIRLGEQTLAEGRRLVADALSRHLSRPLRSQAFLEQFLEIPDADKVG
jgi:DNA repair protein RecO (recombination protein O)